MAAVSLLATPLPPAPPAPQGGWAAQQPAPRARHAGVELAVLSRLAGDC